MRDAGDFGAEPEPGGPILLVFWLAYLTLVLSGLVVVAALVAN